MARIVEVLEEMVGRFRVRLDGYVPVANLDHLIVETPEPGSLPPWQHEAGGGEPRWLVCGRRPG